MAPRLPLTTALAALFALGTTNASAQAVVVVDPNFGNFNDLQSAVNFASAGDTILVHSGSYLGFSTSKGLTITADSGANVVVGGQVIVENLGPNQDLSFIDLTIQETLDGPSLILENNQGSILLQDCSVLAPTILFGQGGSTRVTDCSAVTFVRSNIKCTNTAFGGAQAGLGLQIEDSSVYLYDCELQGGNGGAGPDLNTPGSDGGAGLQIDQGFVYATGSEFVAGNGGIGAGFLGCSDGGSGGSGVRLSSGGPQVVLQECTQSNGVGGMAGIDLVFGTTCNDGFPGLPVLIESGTSQTVTEEARWVTANTPVRDGQTAVINFIGEPGDLIFFRFGFDQNPLYFQGPAIFGMLFNNFPTFGGSQGFIPASGVKQLAFPLSLTGFNVVNVNIQPAYYDFGDDTFYLPNPTAVVLLSNLF